VDDLIAFIRARLDEDDAAARELAGWPHWHHTHAVTAHGPIILIAAGEDDEEDDEIDVASVERDLPEAAEHIARHDPARVLREVEAKRNVLSIIGSSRNQYDGIDDGVADELLKAIASAWSDHPDYRAKWVP